MQDNIYRVLISFFAAEEDFIIVKEMYYLSIETGINVEVPQMSFAFPTARLRVSNPTLHKED